MNKLRLKVFAVGYLAGWLTALAGFIIGSLM